MAPGGLSERDRWVVGACLGAALVVAVGLPLFGDPTMFGSGAAGGFLAAQVVLAPVPACAGVVAAGLTRLPWVGYAIAATAAVMGGVVSLLAFVVPQAGSGMASAVGVAGMIGWIGWPAVAQLPVLAADLVVRRVPEVTPATGALAGALVGSVRLVLRLVVNTLAVGPGGLGQLPPSYWILDLVVPLVLLTVVGMLAGHVAARARAAQSGSGSRTPRS